MKNLLATGLVLLGFIFPLYAGAVKVTKTSTALPSVEESKKKASDNIISIQKTFSEAEKSSKLAEKNYIETKALTSLGARRIYCNKKVKLDVKAESQFTTVDKKEVADRDEAMWFECMEQERESSEKAMKNAASVVTLSRVSLFKIQEDLVAAIKWYNSIPSVVKKPIPAPIKISRDEPK